MRMGAGVIARISNNDTVTRTVLEKTNTEKSTNKPPSSIVIRRPTTVATTLVTMTSSTNRYCNNNYNPHHYSLTDRETQLQENCPWWRDSRNSDINNRLFAGTNFQSPGATVTLMKADNPNITATNVNVQTSSTITCTFNPPFNATAGTWDLVITNTGWAIRILF